MITTWIQPIYTQNIYGSRYVRGYRANAIGLGIHQEVLQPLEPLGSSWTITHIASGLNILPCTFADSEQAMRCVEELVLRFSNWQQPAKKLKKNKKLPEIIRQAIEWAVNEIRVE